jgi:hypothetical protein
MSVRLRDNRHGLFAPLASAGVSVVYAVDGEVFPIELTLAFPSDKGLL